jgi:hypothetical protein
MGKKCGKTIRSGERNSMAEVDRKSVVFGLVSELTSRCFSSRDWPNAYPCMNAVDRVGCMYLWIIKRGMQVRISLQVMSRKTRDELCHEVYAVLLSKRNAAIYHSLTHSPSAFGHQPELGQQRRGRGSLTCIITVIRARQGYAYNSIHCYYFCPTALPFL